MQCAPDPYEFFQSIFGLRADAVRANHSMPYYGSIDQAIHMRGRDDAGNGWWVSNEQWVREV